MPNTFALKLRKHLRTKRLEDVRQLGMQSVHVFLCFLEMFVCFYVCFACTDMYDVCPYVCMYVCMYAWYVRR